MTYPYSNTLNYPQQTGVYYNDQHYKKSSAPIATVGAVVGGGIGAYMGIKKNPFISTKGEASDTFARTVYDRYINKATDAGKEGYKEGLNILKKIDKIKTPEELQSLLDTNKEATQGLFTELKQTPEEFMSKVTSENLTNSKKIIKEKIDANNKVRYGEMKNQIQMCWDKENKKFIKNDKIKDEVFDAIKKSTTKTKIKTVAKYTAIGAITTALLGIVAKILLTNKKAPQSN